MTTIGHCRFLGTGASLGVPVVTCSCEVCSSSSIFNKRLRPSVFLEIEETKILIDCGPDFRQQALTHAISDIDGVILTHAHYDHVEGVDELRVFAIKQDKTIPCLLSKETKADLKKRFYYIFEKQPEYVVTARPDIRVFPEKRGTLDFLFYPFRYFSYEQGTMVVNGIRIGDFAYATDIKTYPETIFEDLEGVKTLVINALRHSPSPIHLSLDEAVEFAKKVGAEKTWFTHISHDLDHEKTNAYLPDNVQLAYDGLSIDFKVEGK